MMRRMTLGALSRRSIWSDVSGAEIDSKQLIPNATVHRTPVSPLCMPIWMKTENLDQPWLWFLFCLVSRKNRRIVNKRFIPSAICRSESNENSQMVFGPPSDTVRFVCTLNVKASQGCVVLTVVPLVSGGSNDRGALGRSITGLYIMDPPGPNTNSSIHQLIRLLLDYSQEGQNILNHISL